MSPERRIQNVIYEKVRLQRRLALVDHGKESSYKSRWDCRKCYSLLANRVKSELPEFWYNEKDIVQQYYICYVPTWSKLSYLQSLHKVKMPQRRKML